MESDGILQSVAIEIPFLYLLSGSLRKGTPVPRNHWLAPQAQVPTHAHTHPHTHTDTHTQQVQVRLKGT